MRRSQRTPLVVCHKDKEITKDVEDINEEEISEDICPLGTGSANDEYPSVYPVPGSVCAAEMYVPLIKNVISDREMMWKDGFTFGNITRTDGVNNYIVPGCKIVSPTGKTSFSRWYKNNSFITILGDGSVYTFGSDGNSKKLSHLGAQTTVTDKLCIIFSGGSYGIVIVLRLIDDRIENAAGENDPQAVTYDPRCDVFKTTRGGWWNFWRTYGGDSTDAPVNLALSGCAYLMYTWNIMNTGKSRVLLYTN